MRKRFLRTAIAVPITISILFSTACGSKSGSTTFDEQETTTTQEEEETTKTSDEVYTGNNVISGLVGGIELSSTIDETDREEETTTVAVSNNNKETTTAQTTTSKVVDNNVPTETTTVEPTTEWIPPEPTTAEDPIAKILSKYGYTYIMDKWTYNKVKGDSIFIETPTGEQWCPISEVENLMNLCNGDLSIVVFDCHQDKTTMENVFNYFLGYRVEVDISEENVYGDMGTVYRTYYDDPDNHREFVERLDLVIVEDAEYTHVHVHYDVYGEEIYNNANYGSKMNDQIAEVYNKWYLDEYGCYGYSIMYDRWDEYDRISEYSIRKSDGAIVDCQYKFWSQP